MFIPYSKMFKYFRWKRKLYIFRVLQFLKAAPYNFDWSENNVVDDVIYAYSTPDAYTGVLPDFRMFMQSYTTQIVYDHAMAMTGWVYLGNVAEIPESYSFVSQ